MILVSACLLGKRTRFDGDSRPCELLVKAAARGRFLLACPESAGRLPVPRPPAEIHGGDGRDVLDGRATVRDREGVERTAGFIAGAQAVLALARRRQVKVAILKANSPSCGANVIYDGTFTKTTRAGMGVCATLLAADGITLYTERDLTDTLLTRLLDNDEETEQPPPQ